MNAFNLIVDKQGLADLVFDLPDEKVNMLNSHVMEELASVIDKLEKEKTIRFLSIRSGKEGNFIAGADIAEIRSITHREEALEKARMGQEILDRLEALPFPTLAAIDGACLGGGLELALACTYRIASSNRKTVLGFPEVGLGIIPGFGGTQRMTALCGISSALTAITGGRQMDAEKSYRIHLVDKVFPKETFPERTKEFISGILSEKELPGIIARRNKKKLATTFLEGTFPGRLLIYGAARKQISKLTHGKYPAPLAALSVIRKTRGIRFAKGLEKERETFSTLAVTPVSKNLIRAYYTSEDLRKSPQSEGAIHEIKSGGVLGAGVMGGAIAWLLGNYEVPVTMVDLDWEFIRRGFQSANGIYKQLLDLKKIDVRIIGLAMQRISGSTDYNHLAGKDIVIEAIVEKLDIKQKALSTLEKSVSEKTIIASNTSSLSITDMASALENPGRFCGMHFFNPVNRMQLVEVIPGARTSADTVASVVSFAKKLHKVPVVVKDSPGFLVNRILMAYLNEAALLAEQGFDIGLIDKAIFDFGMPMGPFTLLDEIGIDIAFEVGKILASAFNGRIIPTTIFGLLRDSKLLGKKTGAGFYIHKGGKRTVNNDALEILQSQTGIPKMKKPDPDTVVKRCIYQMINEAALCMEEGIVAKPEYLDMAMILGTGFPAFRGGVLRFAEETGFASVIDSLKKLENEFGKRFAPAHYLLERKNGTSGSRAA
jgi:3-hydroxyacyl-CoA dehydrogenase / enoyl-CoA hydratase / 3-hydroxybutyryl-CoA epimerase